MSYKDVLAVVVLISIAGTGLFALGAGSWVVTDLDDSQYIESVEVTNEFGTEVNIVTITLTEGNSNISQIHVLSDGQTLGMTTYPVGSRVVEFEVEDISPTDRYQVRLVDRSGQIMDTVDFRLESHHPWF